MIVDANLLSKQEVANILGIFVEELDSFFRTSFKTVETNLQDVRQKAFVLAELNNRPWLYSSSPVNVSSVPDQTIFAGPASKSAEINTKTGQAMIWQTDQAASAFQIVQRPQSGWQNWGTNAENECPSLPVGSLIHTAYGPYQDNWREVADSLASIVKVKTETHA